MQRSFTTSILSRGELLLFPLSVSGHCCLDGASIHQLIFCCLSHSPGTCPHPVLHILLTISLWLFVPLSRHLPSPSPPHPSHNISLVVCPSPDTCPHPVLHILLTISLWLFVPLSRHLPPPSPPHPSHNISLVVRPTLQTLALTQSSTSFSQYLFGCLSLSPDTCPHPVLHILHTISLWLFVPLSRHLPSPSPPHPSHNISLVVCPTLQTLALTQSSTSFSQYLFGCSSHSPDTCPHPVLHILLTISLWLFVPLSRHLPPPSPPHPSHNISLAFLHFFGLLLFLLVVIYPVFGVRNNLFLLFNKVQQCSRCDSKFISYGLVYSVFSP